MSKSKILIITLIALLLIFGGIIFFNKAANRAGQSLNQDNQASPSRLAGPCAKSPVTDPVMVAESSLGRYLADNKCMTLYVFANDKPSESTCNDLCSLMWRPFNYDGKDLKGFTDQYTKNLGIIKRKEGVYQYTYGGKPLYYHYEDKVPGDTTGNGATRAAGSPSPAFSSKGNVGIATSFMEYKNWSVVPVNTN